MVVHDGNGSLLETGRFEECAATVSQRVFVNHTEECDEESCRAAASTLMALAVNANATGEKEEKAASGNMVCNSSVLARPA